MHAVVFDIDGTLLQSAGVDDDLYKEAVRAVISDAFIRPSLSDYDYVSDSGILSQIMTDNSIPNNPAQVFMIKSTFMGLLRAHIAEHGPFPVFPGAKHALEKFTDSPDHAVAIATGGWRESALLKLDTAGFGDFVCPMATADDAFDRAEIMSIAVSQLGSSFSTITYFGDGPWDRDATSRLGWNFVAVGSALGGLESYHDLRDV
jgi:phosphoglycolate phosphatase-like HAD superfamily hydrolase